MTVHCEGDCWLVEQLGDKQDFEAELTRQGCKHEDYSLDVLLETAPGRKAQSSQYYAVTVSNVVGGQQQVYFGGPGENWVAQFSADLARGCYRGPSPGSASNGSQGLTT